ncbi:hypothetical protein [Homoserinibacter gongjuensis]|uniref:Uncharacterized protein n=1 Tax=Homoserinibacter gongjuensis TaxID=1162968 RepID=A0ABQ6JMI4_9MICO|nr:hypothetical protein [Homoserinibacter gongjuensis]GMA89490.1 hypothetical protein GCM10025869_00190 [Homoserinibacter gongjuensis]
MLRHRREARDDWWTVAEDPAHVTLAEVIGAALRVLAMRADGGTALWLALIVEFVQSLNGKGTTPRNSPRSTPRGSPNCAVS